MAIDLPWDPSELRKSLEAGPQPLKVGEIAYLIYAELSMQRGVFVGVRSDSDRTFTVEPLTATTTEIPPGSGLLAISAHYVTATSLLARMKRCGTAEPRTAVQQMLVAGIARPDTFGQELCALLANCVEVPGAKTHLENVEAYSHVDGGNSPRLQAAWADALVFLLRHGESTG